MASVATPNEYNEKTNASIVPDKNDLVRLKNEDKKKNNEKQSNEKRKKKNFFFFSIYFNENKYIFIVTQGEKLHIFLPGNFF